MFYLLAQPTTLSKLQTELRAAIPDAAAIPPWSALEKLPYLSGVVAEGLRLSYGLATRLARVAPDEPMHFRSWDGAIERVVPPGVPVGMTAVHIHHDERIFPDSFAFAPERWLDPITGVRKRDLDGYLLSFSKGGRQCLGMK
jgi:cytochrome P450